MDDRLPEREQGLLMLRGCARRSSFYFFKRARYPKGGNDTSEELVR